MKLDRLTLILAGIAFALALVPPAIVVYVAVS